MLHFAAFRASRSSMVIGLTAFETSKAWKRYVLVMRRQTCVRQPDAWVMGMQLQCPHDVAACSRGACPSPVHISECSDRTARF